MAATDARAFPLKNTAYRVTFPILDADGDLVAGAAGLDSEVSIDGGTFADCASEATQIATSSGVYFLDLTAAEMNGDTIAVIVKTSTTDAKTTVLVFYPVTATQAQIGVNLVNIAGSAVATGTAQLGVNVVNFGGSAGTFAAGRPEANATHIAGSAVSTTTAQIGVNVVQLSTDAVAADNAEAFFDGTGYAGTGNVIPTVTTVTGLTASNLDATISSRATPAQVNTEVLDVLNVDTFAEPSAAPAATTTLVAKIAWLFVLARNKLLQSSTSQRLRNDADSANIATAAVADDGTDASRAEWV